MIRHKSTPKELAATVYKKLRTARIKKLPDENVLVNLFDCLFFTSLKTEENQFIKVTITLIDPDNPDPQPPKRIVADRWNYIHFGENIPLNTKNLVKLSKAADPWSSSLAVYFDDKGELFIWGMIDQAVHYQVFLNYETEAGSEQPGIFQASITDIANIMVIFDYHLIGNLKENVLVTNYIDVLKKGPIYDLLKKNCAPLQSKIHKYLQREFPDNGRDSYWNLIVESTAKECLSRLLLRIQNYHHGGAILITPVTSDLKIKYKIAYSRLQKCIIDLSKVNDRSYILF